MKATSALLVMLVMAIATLVFTVYAGHYVTACILLTFSAMPTWSVRGNYRIWKPWFMANMIDDDQPKMTVFAAEAILFETATMLMIASAPMWVAVLVRIVFALSQMVTSGKLMTELSIPKNDEIRRKSDPGAGARATRQH